MHLRIATCRPLPEPDVDEDLLLEALARAGVQARMAAWNGTNEDWDAAVPTLLRSTWDYVHHLGAFEAWLERAERAAPIWNPRSIVSRNLHKGYLLELERRGVRIVPTALAKRRERTDLRELCARRGFEEIVIKPAVGAGSFSTRRFAPAEHAMAQEFLERVARGNDVLVQPYLRSVEGHGERALVWIEGEFTHAVRKTPRFEGQDEHVSQAVAIEADEHALGRAALAGMESQLCYARVDVARGADGAPSVMELELVEPSLFLRQHPPALARLVDGIRSRLADRAVH